MNVIKSRSFSLVFEPQTFTLFHDRPFFINGGFCTGIGFCTPKKGSHFSRSLPVSNDYILKLPDTRIYLILKNLSVDNECYSHPSSRQRFQSVAQSVEVNWFRLGLKMYIFLTLEFTLL